jgi:hypothetical protein
MRPVEASCGTWLVLSAKHGLLDPDEIIEPYDVALRDLSPAAQTGVVNQRRRATGVTPIVRLLLRI